MRSLWERPFATWVADYRVSRLSAALGVTDSAVYGWVHGTRIPRPRVALRIVEISEGRVQLGDIYRTTDPESTR